MCDMLNVCVSVVFFGIIFFFCYLLLWMCMRMFFLMCWKVGVLVDGLCDMDVVCGVVWVVDVMCGWWLLLGFVFSL